MILEVKHLSVCFPTPDGDVQALQDISFLLESGEALAIVGESGCGKSVLCKSILKLLPPSARVSCDRIVIAGVDTASYKEHQLRRLRGSVCAAVLQDPMTALNPSMTIGAQIAEAVRVDRPKLTRAQIRDRVIELMQMTGIDRPGERMQQYPHQLSGGLRQRSVIAAALACGPQLLLADEPTTALDAVTQAQLLTLLSDIRRKTGMALVFVTHDLRAAAQVADRIAVMRAGEIVECGTVERIFQRPEHPCTRRLLGAFQDMDGKGYEMDASKLSAGTEVLLDVQRVSCRLPLVGNTVLPVLKEVSFQIYPGEIFGLVGESGCGKSTTARCIMNLQRPDSGSIFYSGIYIWDRKQYRDARRMLQQSRQLVFQDSASSLNPRMRVWKLVTEPLRIQRIHPKRGSLRAEAEFQLRHVGLGPEYLDRYAHELSGGQRQRVSIARALTMEPRLLVADEPLTSLDAWTQRQVACLFRQLQREHGFSMLLIAHDLAMVRWLCDRVGVMYEGNIVECAPAAELFSHPKHSYTRALLDAAEPLSWDIAQSS